MDNDVIICNRALSIIGESSIVTSINPSDGSAYADYCEMFYPMARDFLLESHFWSFATRRKALEYIECPRSSHPGETCPRSSEDGRWQYVYLKPEDSIKIVSVYQRGDTVEGEDYSCEITAAGEQVIYTNVFDAYCLFIKKVEDVGTFSQFFITALTFNLASMLAGTIIKGDVGAAESKRCLGISQAYAAMAANSDAAQSKSDQKSSVYPWTR